MPLNANLFGEQLWQGTDTNEVRALLRKHPAAADNTANFFFLILRERCPWVCQLDEARQLELRAFCRDLESLRRRRQELRH